MELTKLLEAACCQSACLRPIWQLHPRVSCPHQLNIGVNTELGHVTRDTARTSANDAGCQNTREWGIRFPESSGLNHNLADRFRENKKFKVFLE